MKTNYSKYLLLLCSFFILGCSNIKYLPDGDLLYTGGSVKVEDSIIKRKDRKALETELENLLRPKPNKQILGLRPKLLIYNLAGKPTKDKGLQYWLSTKVGEPPVLFSQVDLEYNAAVLRNYTENRGYFKTKVQSDSTRHGKKATAEYTVWPSKQYKIKTVTFPDDSTALGKAISRTQKRSLLIPGNPYDLEVIKSERDRIDARLKEKGYYFFNPDYILAQVDSSKGNQEVNIRLKIKEETPTKARKPYSINDIIVYPNYSILTDSIAYKKEDVVQYKDFTIIDSAKTFNPRVFDRTLYFKKGDLYNRKNHNLSLNRFVSLGTFKFVKNEFKVDDSIPDALNAYYYLTMLPEKFLRFEVGASTNSAGYTGTDLKVNWNHRNTFGGAELFTLSLFGGADFQLSGKNGGNDIYTFGGEASLIWPRLIAPFKWQNSSEFVPKTKVLLRYERQSKAQLYTLNSFKTSFVYLWKESAKAEHELKVIEINYVSPQNVTAEYQQEILANPSLGKVIEKQLIFGPAYSYTFTNTMQKRKKNTFYFNGELDLAGNITGLIMGANAKKGDTIKFFDVPFSQYVKVKGDFRHYLKLGENSKLATRLIAGVGYAYGNNTEMPSSRQFVIGGANSIRAFRSQSVGPGSYKDINPNPAFLPDQTGDIKLEFNTEYRTKLFSIVNGALFLDAGNIWLLNENPEESGGQISKDFMKQIAVGVGAGLRFDFSFLILRTDLAFPIRQPYLVNGSNWVFDAVDFGSGAWRKENLVLSIAIGYPF
ncbi:BamA/TamA family outer membrane protein [Flavobacterium sp. N3904]|uniref:translocation and assembly module lipoprotein TamL n=1 Tax=Flavobacterium sp. N3904 TaxID=2986835 RepID=UPI0022249046|nr:BamA/TamA family outer membrane protein [Flavobacterium sp. N3904]